LLYDEAPLVRGAAVWALARLVPARLGDVATGRRENELDADVKAEWATALSGG
jgi:epoxyqueuosine reductase